MLPRCQCWALSRDELTTPTVVLYEYEHGYSAMVAAFPAAFTKATSVVVDMLVTVAFTELYALGLRPAVAVPESHAGSRAR
ncbi:hypothetical protein EYZ11_010744 [Aspergillus tanneri]|uniref:Uncharacterized protein n=1 Tax=Aspergillus tanneri TaxID=1220188 RepID=A0A4S3J4W2_9EURO|nr:hypothetical protein EYZ11_010744 [Aspergillus tanneri]